MAESVLKVEGIGAGYGGGNILQDVDIAIGEGEVVAAIGRNGVGKTTLMRCMIGLLQPTSGQIIFGGRDVTGFPSHQRAAMGMGYVPQGREIFPELTVAENLRLGEQINATKAEPRYDLVFRYFPVLKERRRQLGGTLSGGQQQMLAIGRALVGNPRLLLLDEPSVGIQPSIVHEIAIAVTQLNADESVTVFVVEQNLEFISKVSQRAYAFDKGRVVATFSGEQLDNRELLVRYLAVAR